MEQKTCPLRREEWSEFLETMLSVKHSNYPILMNILVAFATLGVVIVFSFAAALYGKTSVINYVVGVPIIGTAIMILTVGIVGRHINKEIKRNREEYERI